MKRYRIVAVVVIVLMMSVFLTRLPQTHATFVIAGWDYPRLSRIRRFTYARMERESRNKDSVLYMVQ
ncbi:MAG: hypothetical protein ACW99G_22350 [Candidatus Thorarchaeota archaeon]